MKKKLLTVLLAGTMGFCLLSAASGSQVQAAEETAEAPAEEDAAAEPLKVITNKAKEAEGENAEGEAAETVQMETAEGEGTEAAEEPVVYEVKMKNSTGKGITGFSIKEMEETEYPENFLEEEDVFAADEERILDYEVEKEEDAEGTEETAEKAQAEENGDEKLLTPGYDIQLTFEDETVMELHAFPFGDLEACEIKLEDEVAFITYISLTDAEGEEGQEEPVEVSTKEAELAILEQKKAEAAAAEAAAQAQYYNDNYDYEEPSYEEPVYEEPAAEEPVYEEPVAEEPVYEEPVAEEPVYEEPVYEEPSYEEPVYEEPAEEGGGDSCLEGGLVF